LGTAVTETVRVSVRVNGTVYEHDIEPRLLLGDFLRVTLNLTGTHFGCEHGICGACTVHLDGMSVRSCLTFAVQADGAEVLTVEGLGTVDELHPLQAAFREHHGLQCGYCTPGMLMTALDIIRRHPKPTAEEIREHISGNLCRCTGYQNIVAAIAAAGEATGE
jgi:carbon-monoxide dehydrogenase small subunit